MKNTPPPLPLFDSIEFIKDQKTLINRIYQKIIKNR